jgi:methionine biosynthesis protein MetW
MLGEGDLQHFKAEGLERFIPQILKLLPPNMDKLTVLDIGCGPGIIAYSIKTKLGAQVFGVDCDSTFIEQTKSKGLTVYNCNLEADKLPFSNASFDYVLCIEVIEHLSKPENCLSEISRVLKPKGELILSTPNLAALQYRFSIISGRDPLSGHPFDRPYDRHIRLYALNSLTQLVTIWFKITKVVYLNHPPRKTWKGAIRDMLCFLKKDLASTLIVDCQPLLAASE